MGEILNKAELITKRLTQLPDNSSGSILPAAHRESMDDLMESGDAGRGAAITGGITTLLGINTTPVLYTGFDTNSGLSDTVIFTADAANDKIIVNEPCVVDIEVSITGEWDVGDVIVIEVLINGAPFPTFPLIGEQVGEGGGDTVTVRAESLQVVPTGSEPADITVQISTAAGSTNLDQSRSAMQIFYLPYSIRTV